MNKQTPQVISNIKQQLGRALMYVGARNLLYSAQGATAEGAYPSSASEVTPEGYLKSECYLQFDVNLKRAQTWRMFVCYEPSDTYTVRLMRINGLNTMAKTGKVSQLMSELSNVYCDQLQSIVESMYDEAINKHNGGFINI